MWLNTITNETEWRDRLDSNGNTVLCDEIAQRSWVSDGGKYVTMTASENYTWSTNNEYGVELPEDFTALEFRYYGYHWGQFSWNVSKYAGGWINTSGIGNYIQPWYDPPVQSPCPPQ